MAAAAFESHRQISDHFCSAAQLSTRILPDVSYATSLDVAPLLNASVRFTSRRLDEGALRCAVELLEQEEQCERIFLFQLYAEEQRCYFMLHYKDYHAAVLHYTASCSEIALAASRGSAAECLAQSKKIAAWSSVLKLISSQEILVPLQCP
jgi:hypothetical protein